MWSSSIHLIVNPFNLYAKIMLKTSRVFPNLSSSVFNPLSLQIEPIYFVDEFQRIFRGEFTMHCRPNRWTILPGRRFIDSAKLSRTNLCKWALSSLHLQIKRSGGMKSCLSSDWNLFKQHICRKSPNWIFLLFRSLHNEFCCKQSTNKSSFLSSEPKTGLKNKLNESPKYKEVNESAQTFLFLRLFVSKYLIFVGCSTWNRLPDGWG